MKKLIIATLIFAYSLIGLNIDAKALTYTNDQSKIEQMIVNVPSKIFIYPGDTFDISIRTKNLEVYDNIKYEIKDNILYIDLNDKRMLEDQMLEPKDVRINIQVPNNIKKIKTNSNMLVATVKEKNNNATNYGNN